MNNLRTAILLCALAGMARAEPIETLTEGGVTVTFEKTGDSQQIDEFKKTILPEIKTILSDLSSDLGGNAKGANVSFFSPETYHARFPQTVDTQVPAFYDGKNVYARADNDLNHALKVTLRHELTHLILDHAYSHIPGWLNEGMAEFQERKITTDPAPTFVDYNTLHIAKQDGKYISLSSLEAQGIFSRSEGTVTAGLGYTTAYVAVYELKEKFGMSQIRNYLAALSKGGNTGIEFQKTFGMPYDKFNDYLLEKAAKK